MGRGARVQNRRYLFLVVWPSRQARNAAAACSRSSALLSRRRGCLFAGGVTIGVPPLTSSTPRRRIRLRCFIRDQFVRPVMTRPSQQSRQPMSENQRLCLSAQTMPRMGHLAPFGLSNRRAMALERLGPTSQSYTRAQRLGTNWVMQKILRQLRGPCNCICVTGRGIGRGQIRPSPSAPCLPLVSDDGRSEGQQTR